MNLICSKNNTCQCRETMAWNKESSECQIYIVSKLSCLDGATMYNFHDSTDTLKF